MNREQALEKIVLEFIERWDREALRGSVPNAYRFGGKMVLLRHPEGSDMVQLVSFNRDVEPVESDFMQTPEEVLDALVVIVLQDEEAPECNA